MRILMARSDLAASLRLWQLISPSLPIGSYAYSNALEWVIQSGELRDAAAVGDWVADTLRFGLARTDLPVLVRVHAALSCGDEAAAARWCSLLGALRETAELRLADNAMGAALVRLLADLGMAAFATEPATAASATESATAASATPRATPASSTEGHAGAVAAQTVPVAELPLAGAFAAAAAHWGIASGTACAGYAWAWCESQVTAAIKLVPLGHTAGQRVLLALGDAIEAAVETALDTDDEEIGYGMPGLAIASALHETQYTRLFRS